MHKIALLLFISIICNTANLFADTETIYMTVGETKKLAPTVLTTKVIQGMPAWTSSRPFDLEIIHTDLYTATIKAIRPFSGYATIHCLYYFQELHPINGTIIAQRSGYIDYNVFVEDNGSKPEATSISISPQSVSLNYGDTYELKVTILPSNADQNVTWTTTDRTVTFVNNVGGAYILGGNGYGSAIVTATTTNGLQASCTVQVGNNSTGEGDNSGNNPEIPESGQIINNVELGVKRINNLHKIVNSLLNKD